jgi:hypothetical protein
MLKNREIYSNDYTVEPEYESSLENHKLKIYIWKCMKDKFEERIVKKYMHYLITKYM